jgi:glycine C-acetyltransferase
MIDDAQGEGVLGRVLSRSARSPKPFENSVFTMAIGCPTAPKGKERLRVMISATHLIEDLDFAVRAFEKVGKEVWVI